MTVYAFPSISSAQSSVSLFAPQRVMTSPFIGTVQTGARPSASLRLVMSFFNISNTDDKRRELQGFLTLLEGKKHRFTVHDHTYVRGGSGTGGQVDGASEAGNSITTKNWADGASPLLVFKRGDQFSLNTSNQRELKIVTVDATTDGAGAVEVFFGPPIRTTPADSLTLDITNPLGQWMLADAENGWTNELGSFSDFIINAIEDTGVT